MVKLKLTLKAIGVSLFLLTGMLFSFSGTVGAEDNIKTPDEEISTLHQCGTGDQAVRTSIDFGCRGEKCLNGDATEKSDPICKDGDRAINGIMDLMFAVIRFLSTGVGIVIIGSLIVAGLQYTSSRGDPQATSHAIKRIFNTVIALVVFIFAYAILNFVVPNGVLS